MILPNYQIQQQSLTPEEIVDVVPELEKSNRDIQRSEEAYLRELELNNERSLRNYEKNWEGLGTLSKTIQDLVQQKQDKFRQDRAAVLAYQMATEGVSPELEEVFRGDRELLFEDSLQAEEFANKLEEAGDGITANKFRDLSKWEQYIVGEEWARKEAKDYHQYRLEALDTTTVKVVRDGQEVEIGGQAKDPQGNPSLPENEAEQEALEEKIKFNFTRRFGGLNEVLVATVVKPELDAYDALRRKEQIAEREEARQVKLKQRDKDSIKNGFITANPVDGYNNAHNFSKQYSTRNKTRLGAGRTAFKNNLISLVKSGDIDPVDVGPMLLYEEEANDGSMKSMTSWKEWEDLPELLAEASVAYKQSKLDDRKNEIALDEQKIRSRDDWTNDEKAILRQLYKQKEEYDGRVPSELESALAGHEEDYLAEERLNLTLIRQNDKLYDYQLANVSPNTYKTYKQYLTGQNALIQGTQEAKDAAQFIRGYTDIGAATTTTLTDTASPSWIYLNQNLTSLFNREYQAALYNEEGVKINSNAGAFKIAIDAVKAAATDEETAIRYQKSLFDDVSNEEYLRGIGVALSQAGGGKWKTNKIYASIDDQNELINWAKNPKSTETGIPEHYKGVAERLEGVAPYDLAQRQAAIISEGEVEVKDREVDEIENKPNRVRLLYHYPTKSRLIRSLIDYGYELNSEEPNVKTDVHNKNVLLTPGV